MSSDLELPESVCGIIDDAGFTSPLEMIRIGSKEKLRFELLTDLFARIVNVGTKIWGGFDLKEANACAAVSKTSVPVLIIHGDKDKKAPVSMAYKIYNSCKSERELYIVSGAEHTGCYRTDPEKYKMIVCNGVQREHNKKLNNGLPILHKVPPKRDYGRYFCIMAEKGGTSHGGLTEKLSPFFHAKKQEVNAYGR